MGGGVVAGGDAAAETVSPGKSIYRSRRDSLANYRCLVGSVFAELRLLVRVAPSQPLYPAQLAHRPGNGVGNGNCDCRGGAGGDGAKLAKAALAGNWGSDRPHGSLGVVSPEFEVFSQNRLQNWGGGGVVRVPATNP